MASTRFPSALPPHAPVALQCRTSETAPQAVNGGRVLLTGSGPSLILLDQARDVGSLSGHSLMAISMFYPVCIWITAGFLRWATPMHLRGTSPLSRILYASHQVRGLSPISRSLPSSKGLMSSRNGNDFCLSRFGHRVLLKSLISEKIKRLPCGGKKWSIPSSAATLD